MRTELSADALRHKSAIDGNNLRRNETGSVGREKDRHTLDFFEVAEALHGGVRHDGSVAHRLVDECPVQRGFKYAGSDGVDANIVLCPLGAQAPREHYHRSFA